jgi:transposase, IS5 family
MLAERYNLTGWRQSKHNIKKLKAQYRKIQKIKHSTSKDEEKKRARSELIKQEHQIYIDRASQWIEHSERMLQQVNVIIGVMVHETLMLRGYQAYANTFIGQIYRRVIQGEKIPHSEKIFSIFQPHTEWIKKGKAGVFVELGLRVSIMEDQHGFILHHKVMERESDEKVTVEMVQERQNRFPAFSTASFDKGYYTLDNLKELQQRLQLAVLPKKGKRSEADQEREGSEEFGALRKQHSAVESAINALEQHGLDTCPDHATDGFKRYVALAVVSRNIYQLGSIIRKQQLDKEKRKRGHSQKAA